MKTVMMGNEAAAMAVKLARVQVVSAYPITPQTVIVESLADIIGRGDLKAKYLPVESEHTAMATAWARRWQAPGPLRQPPPRDWPTCMKCSILRPVSEYRSSWSTATAPWLPLEPVLRPHRFPVPTRHRLDPVLLLRCPGCARRHFDRLCGCRASAFARHDQSGRILFNPYFGACGCAGSSGGGSFSSPISSAVQAECG